MNLIIYTKCHLYTRAIVILTVVDLPGFNK